MPGGGRHVHARVAVWDRPVRLLHWLLAAAVLACWFTTTRWHEWTGLAAGAVAALRVLWGFTGGPRARFADFVRGPSATLRYAAQVLRGAEPRHLGHNPLGGWMVVALLAVTLALAATGWLYVHTDAFWGDPVLEAVHVALGWTLMGLVSLHVAAVLVMGWRHGENLVRAMLDGRKAPASASDAE